VTTIPDPTRAAPAPGVSPLRIGSVQLATNLLVAPIAGYTDLAYRLIARRLGGVGLACTDLLCPQGVLRQTAHTRILMQTCEEDSPLCYQLFGAENDPLVEAARWCVDHGARIIDINMGCPADKVTQRRGGSALLCDPDGTVRMVEKIVAAIPNTPVTAKLRLGWDDQHIVAPYLARRLEEVGVQLITIHGRTTEMGFSGSARLDGIAEVVSAVGRIPVVGNGDIRTPQDAARMMQVTRCAGVMIGRGALSAPWLYRDTWEHLSGRSIPTPPTLEEKCQILRNHFDLHVQLRGEHSAACEFRTRISWYAKEMHPCRPLKDALRQLDSAVRFHCAVDDFLRWRASM